MNRRGFLQSMLKAAVACAVLPSALTYNRVWKPTPPPLLVLDTINVEMLYGVSRGDVRAMMGILYQLPVPAGVSYIPREGDVLREVVKDPDTGLYIATTKVYKTTS